MDSADVLTTPASITDGEFPIWCKECHYPLRGLGEVHRCPECGLEFDRGARLVELYGPELFLEHQGETVEPPRAFPFANLGISIILLILMYAACATSIIYVQSR